MSVIFQISLKSILVKENGWIDDPKNAVNVISATLYYPREGVAALTSMRDIKLKDDITLDYPLSISDEPYKQIVFKELIRSDSSLVVEITAKEKKRKIVKILKKALGDSIEDLLKLVPGLGSVVTAVATSLGGSLLESGGTKAAIIGRGMMPLTEATPDGDFVVQLAVPKKIKIRQRSLNENGAVIEQRRTLKKGFANAMVVFSVKRIEF